jgi:molybdopterin biosynthesis enzyme
LVYPLADLFAGTEEKPSVPPDEQADSVPGESVDEAADANAEEPTDESNDLPTPEPVRDWDLPSQNQRGRVTLPRLAERPPENMIPIGSWARNRETILPEKTIIRPPEFALLAALGIEEIEVYRRPVVGVASLGPPFPQAGKESGREVREGTCPLQALVVQLARSARVAALPLGFAPPRFRPLAAAVRRWVKQVDLLLLVGGSHHGPRSLGNDVLTAVGEPQLVGLDLTPSGGLSAGKVGNRPLIVMPGSLPDVLCGFVLLVRPLAHKYLTPHHYSCEVDLVLERGSQLQTTQDTAVPVRFGFSQDRQAYATHYAGQQQDPWLDFVRGQALVVLERDRQYKDGETVTAHTY